MATSLRWTSADLELLPDPLDDKRYEIIDGELYVAKQPSFQHQFVCTQAARLLQNWCDETGAGIALIAPGLIFTPDENVAPDVVWLSPQTLPHALGPDGKLHAAPNLVIEVLSPGEANERHDREAKLGLYSRRGVREYWIVDWQERRVEVYRWWQTAQRLESTLLEGDEV